MATAPASLLADPSAELHACLTRLAAFDVASLSGAQQAALLQSLARAEARVAAVRLRVLAAAEKARTARQAGASSTGAWAASLSHLDPVAGQRQAALASGLESRTATQEALSSGAISTEHASVIIRADRDLPASVTPAQRDQVEAALVSKASLMTPTQLRRAARRALSVIEASESVVDAHEDELVAAEEERARSKTRLTLHDNDDGTVTGHFTVPALQGAMLRKILQAMTAPRRGRLGAAAAQVGEQSERTDWDRARGLAFCELLEHLPTDHLHPRTAATVVVTIAEETMRGALKAAGLDTGEVISAGEARRIACEAKIYPAVLSGESETLDFGRALRVYSEKQRLAHGVKHQSCAADGCDRPYAWCELHHVVPWASGGRTDLANAVPLCHFHHQRIHDRQYVHEWEVGGTLTFAPKRRNASGCDASSTRTD